MIVIRFERSEVASNLVKRLGIIEEIVGSPTAIYPYSSTTKLLLLALK